jgi:hypothetical protein
MRGFAGYVLIGSIAAFATCGMMLVGLSLGVNAHQVVGQNNGVQHVDRSHKEDRLEFRTKVGREPMPTVRRAPVGCDPVFSSLSSAPRNPSGRCVA